MGKKYIIELLDDCPSEFKGIMVFGLTQEKQISVELIPEESLTPYTEHNMEQIRKEAYKDGYDAGFGRKIDASYQEGLSDAWEAARKIIHMPEADLLNLFPECYAAVCTSVQVFLKYDASECIEKIRAYEQGKEEIKVGDEVISPDGKGVVTEISDRIVRIMYSSGSGYIIKPEELTKTGRHFSEIAEVLQKMKESDNG